jgi:phage terminase large subunit GpA-like protein
VELEIVGWCRDKSTYSFDYRFLQGDTSEKDVWDKLAEVVNETWLRPDGVELPMMLMAVDSGYNTQHVYDFCRRFDASRVIPIKGSDTQRTTVSAPRSVDINMHGKATGMIKLWSVGSSVVKSEVYANLRLHPNEDGTYPPNYCHFPEYAPEFFKGITAEQIVVSQSHGYLKYQWEKKYARNEPLDCRVYARAAATVAGMDRFNEGHWDALIGKYRRTVRGKDEPQYQKQPQKAKKPSSFWGDR